MKIVLLGTEHFCKTCATLIKPSHNIINQIYIDAVNEPIEKYYSEDIVFITQDRPNPGLLQHKKWIVMADFKNITLYNPLASLSDECRYYGILMGMSHSQCAIDVNKINQYKWYKEAAPSLDIFLHNNFFRSICKYHYNSIKDTKRIIIELPYYIFNYDLSKFGDFTKTKLYYFSLVNNFHNFGLTNQQKLDIEKFILYEEVFKEMPIPDVSNESISKYQLLKDIFHAWRAIRNKDKVWTTLYDSTIQENACIFSEMIEFIRMVCPKANMKILVMPFNPAFRDNHKSEIIRMKRLFYDLMKENKLEIIDDFDYVNDFRCFADHCHLNSRGIQKYQERVSTIMK